MENNNIIVITFGTFDLFHQGHYNILKRASLLGNKLIVGISSDYFTSTKKGVEPIDNQEIRMKKVKDLDFVSDVFLEESMEMKKEYIKMYKANLLVMGDDWTGKFDDLGCRAVYLPRTPNISSTQIKKTKHKNIVSSLKPYLKLNGTYKVPLAKTEDIFPLKKYKFYDFELYGPKSYKVMEDYYGKKCPMRTHAYAKWKKPLEIFKLTNFEPGEYKYGINPFSIKSYDHKYCTKWSKACVHTPEKYIENPDTKTMTIRPCCRQKLNDILIDTCKALEKFKIPYFIYWGTLLGSIRHKGSIPWDTDNDLYILDKDVDKLNDVFKELGDKYVITRVRPTFFRINFSYFNRIHCDIYIAEQKEQDIISFPFFNLI